MKLRWLFAFALLTLSAPSLRADTATVTGRVSDPSGAPVPEAKVGVKNLDTGLWRSTVTSSSGMYTVPELPPGKYQVQVQAQGFETLVQTDIVLQVQDTAMLNYSLKIGSVSTTVTVEGGAPMVQTESASVGTVVDRRFVESMPLNGRSLQSLLILVPGVVLTPGIGQFSTNGQRGTSNYVTVDGVGANIGIDQSLNPVNTASGATAGFNAFGGTNGLVSLEALQEFKIQTSSFSAEYGRTPGGQVSLVTRSGTNQIHGSLFDYLRNDAFDATDWFINSQGLAKSALRQNNFGGTFGGPVVLPKLLGASHKLYDGRNRTFFFLSYEELRLRTPLGGIATVPSIALRQEVAPALQSLLNAFPVPTEPSNIDGVGFLPYSYSNPSNMRASSVKIDHSISDRMHTFFRYNEAPSSVTTRNLNSLYTVTNDIRTVTGGVIASIHPRLSTDLRLNYSTNKGNNEVNLDSFGGAVLPDTGSLFRPPYAPASTPSLAPDNSEWSLGTPYGSLALGRFALNTQRQVNVVNDTSWTFGGHHLKFGMDYRRLMPEIEPRLMLVSVQFLSVTSFRNSLADQISLRSNNQYFPVYRNLSLYVQDRLKLNTRLTLDYGMRWDLNLAPFEANGLKPTLLADPANPATSGISSSRSVAYRTPFTNVGPRLGIAYQLVQTPGRELVIRLGGGMFYDLGTGPASALFNGYPYVNSFQIRAVPFPPPDGRVVLPPINPTPPYPGVIYGYDSGYRTPFTVHWNFAVDQALGRDQKFTATYLGNIGRRLVSTLSYQALNRNVPFIEIVGDRASSSYEAMQLQFQRRLSKGLQALASYSWSHAIDTVSNEGTNFLTKGAADFDFRHVASAAVSYDLPSRATGGFAKILLEHWTFDSIVRTQSAPPVDLVFNSRLNFQVGSNRPDLISGEPIYLDDPFVAGGRRLNPAAFKLPPSGRFGSLGRNAIRGFPLSQADVSLHREFRFTERANLSFRADAFNVLNHPNFGPPTNPVYLGNGQATSTIAQTLGNGNFPGLNALYSIGGPRSIQLSLKLQF